MSPVLVFLAVAGLQLVAQLPAPAAAFPLDEDLQNTLFELGFIDLSQYGRSIFGEPDNSTGERLANYHAENSTQNPEELGSYLEGDILMPIGQARNGLSANAARWPNAIVPYEIRGNFGTTRRLSMCIECNNKLYIFLTNRRVPNEPYRDGLQRVSHAHMHPIPAAQ